MSFWKRKRRERQPEEEAISERNQQKRRSMHADEDYYKAMRRLAVEGHDAAGVRFYEEKLEDLQNLKYELDVLSNDQRAGERRSE